MPLPTAASLDALRQRGDPLADAAVAALQRPPARGENVLELVRQGAAAGSPALQAFLDATKSPPPWADFEAMEAGRRAAMRSAPVTFLVLLTGSLIESFAVAPGALVLARTGRLLRDTTPRLYETASMLRDLLLPAGARPGSPGHTALVRVRLLHAAVRRFASKGAPPGYQPVNQLEMLHTLLMFSLVVARGIEELGVRLGEEERESWSHLWRHAGFVLGVEDEALFRSATHEREIYELVRRDHYAPDEHSRALAAAVLDALGGEPPFFVPREGLHALSRRLLGDELADSFGLFRSRRWAAFAGALAAGSRASDLLARRLPLGSQVALAGGHAFVELNRFRVKRTLPIADFVFRTA